MMAAKNTPKKTDFFSATDIDILQHAVSIFPNLEYACFALKLAKKHITFPVKSHAELAGLLDTDSFQQDSLPERISARGLRKGHVKKYFPKVFFPIEDERDFLGKLLAALTWGDTVHFHEQYLEHPERFSPSLYRKEE